MNGIEDVPVGKVWQGQQAALMRLQLWATGRTHGLMRDMAGEARAALVKGAGADGKLTSVGMLGVRRRLEDAWAGTFGTWKREMNGLKVCGGGDPVWDAGEVA